MTGKSGTGSQSKAQASWQKWCTGRGIGTNGFLVDDYSRSAEAITILGLNGGMLDLKHCVFVERSIPPDEQAWINHIVDNKSITNSGRLYKARVAITNCQAHLKALKKSAAVAEELKEKAQQ